MKKIIFPLLIAGGLLTGATLTSTGDSGKSIFLDNKCNKCHSIESLGIKHTSEPPEGAKYPPPDLSGVGLRHDAEWMTKWLHKEVELHDKKHMKKFGGSDDDLKTLTLWLVTLKKK
jgi:cbb3-type cytochrome oxidase cytochrome c subunit